MTFDRLPVEPGPARGSDAYPLTPSAEVRAIRPLWLHELLLPDPDVLPPGVTEDDETEAERQREAWGPNPFEPE